LNDKKEAVTIEGLQPSIGMHLNSTETEFAQFHPPKQVPDAPYWVVACFSATYGFKNTTIINAYSKNEPKVGEFCTGM